MIYTIVKSKNCECSVSVTIWKSAFWGPTRNYSVVQQKIHFSSRTNYTAYLSLLLCDYFADVVVTNNLGQIYIPAVGPSNIPFHK